MAPTNSDQALVASNTDASQKQPMSHVRKVQRPHLCTNRLGCDLDLDTVSPKARYAEYCNLFEGESRIEDLEFPPLADHFPHLAQEITAAYLATHAFRFKVYMNYDAAAVWFYDESASQRYGDCGKLVITPKTMAKLHRANAHKSEYSKVVLDISTHFRLLARITIEVRGSKVNVGPVVDTYVNYMFKGDEKHKVMNKHVYNMAKGFEDPQSDVTLGKYGLDFKDLERMVDCFAPLPTDEQRLARFDPWYNGHWSHENKNDEGYQAHLFKERWP
ncbi:hypothetical protein LTR78_005543 [Recurvomyces mirabilis]|uniref:Uncharacterized protein n=1 Tax=Recurvomyces mirabilis TaxID=574656 RepID=A0AAE1C1G8_9PEZI|nr:hypothetical protein LTR78_005543 [Recurvomyces mirabilis]KAK5158466.1 hypothetical protein LTS14_003485 [Recurvomyces mirabilis]